MGVAGLWDVIRPAGKTRSLTELSITEGFEANPDGVRGFRLGIDASIWFFHAEYGKEGENPVLRTLFFRCATLMHSPFLPLFVFDGPKRPEWKRGKKINRTSNKLIPGMKAIVESFGFEWRMAPGEAEAELAYLNRIGVIDGILSDDVDNFLFGATTVIRNASNNLSGNRSNPILNAAGKDDKNHTKVYRMLDITAHQDVRLTRGGLILIGLMSGGDYHQEGLNGCGTVTSHGLAKCGFGDTLFQAANNMTRDQLKTFLIAWRHELCHELRTNSKGYIGRKHPSLANSVPSEFPDIDVLLSYTNPITSESMGRTENNLRLTWSKEPDLGKLAATCEFYFEWGYKEAIIKRFRTVVWHSAVLRILRRAVLDIDAKSAKGALPPATPQKAGKIVQESIGTPSNMIARHFSTMNLGASSDDEDDDDEPLIVKIHSERKHVSTDGILEYRLEIAPAQLVRIAESGIKGTRSPEGLDEWADEDGDGKGVKKPPPDPKSHLRVWMPACMVRIVEPQLVEEFEAAQEKRRSKKSGKGGKTKPKVVPTDAAGSEDDDLSVSKQKKKTISRTQAKVVPEDADLQRVQADEPALSTLHTVRDLTKKKPGGSSAGGSSAGGLKSFFVATKPSAGIKPKAPAPLSALSTLSTLDAFTVYGEGAGETAILIPTSPVTDKRKPTSSTSQISVVPIARDLTKKKANAITQQPARSTPLDTFLLSSAKLSPPKNNRPNAFVSKAKQCVNTNSDEDSSANPMLASPMKPNRLAAWNKAPISTYVTVSDSDDDVRGSRRLGPDDSHMYESDDPFDSAPRCSSPKTRQAREKQAAPASDSDAPTDGLPKSPRKSKEHISPRNGPGADFHRPCSPTTRRTCPLPVIEISDSEDELPPVHKILQVPPLLRARSRIQGKASGKQVTLDSFVARPPLNERNFKLAISNEVIDLT
ncbi:hypothetical protein H0H87_008393 [Tephrocybe sp. NHM501043]|nr:hypothetical protein H0H87_008393 [Tephrocybe sp. NHM501043]